MGERLRDKAIVITGATRGIGKGIAMKCAEEGARLVLNGIHEEEGRQTAQELKQAYGTEAVFLHADIRSEEACRQLIEEAVRRFGRLDGLVNNAGIYPSSSLVDTTEELYDTIMDVNVKGAFFCTKHAVQAMLSTGGGSIVHMGSLNGYKGAKDLAAYSCSKGALLTLSRHIAHNYMRDHIRSNWITVGWVASEGEIEVHQSMGKNAEELISRAESYVPSGRMQTPEDMAHGAVYLLSEESSQVTGTELTISGGLGV
ncbi:SDR family NAD(P)-dependent oxidoreductase [Paenibacillus sp. TAB 01]|uniref:SDR family NAD(P)-dependent oxidoreductase n=1 Tax=Paenibacillus sp. TAB 01 TaxID=3368988 RepID=UPI003753548A